MAMIGSDRRVRPPLAEEVEVVEVGPRQPSIGELTELVEEWLGRAVARLWLGDVDGAAAYYLPAAQLSLKIDLDAVDLGSRLGYWSFPRLCDWVDEAKASTPRARRSC